MKAKFQVTKNTYKEKGIMLKNDDVMSHFSKGQIVHTELSSGQVVNFPVTVFSDKRGLYIKADIVKKLKLAQPKKNGPKLFIELEF